MADSPAEGTPRLPPKPEVRRSAVLPPPRKASSTDRVVVTLSSVAKTPAAVGSASTGMTVPPNKLSSPPHPPPPKPLSQTREDGTVAGVAPALRAPQLNRTMKVKLPEKSGVLPKLTSLSSMPLTAADVSSAPPPESEIGGSHPPPALPKSGVVPAFKLKPLRLETSAPGESIFPDEPKHDSAAFKNLPPRDLPKPASADEPPPAITRAPGLREDSGVKSPDGLLAPPHMVETPTTPHLAPPLMIYPTSEAAEKHRLPPPTLKKAGNIVPVGLPIDPSAESSDSKLPAPRTEEPGTKIPPRDQAPPQSLAAFLKSATSAGSKPGLPPVSAGDVPPQASQGDAPVLSALVPEIPEKKPTRLPAKIEDPSAPTDSGFLLEQAANLPSATRAESVSGTNFKSETADTLPKHKGNAGFPPAMPGPLKGPVKRSFLAALFAPKTRKVSAGQKISASGKRVRPAANSAARLRAQPTSVTALPPPSAPPAVPATTATPAPGGPKPPGARSARTQKRRMVETIVFYVIFLGFVVPLLLFLGLRFSTETRVEGQVIPPPGTMLCDEVWIVSDFRALAAGIADDLAAERAPKIQEIQERQDHVHRAQADIAAREERIRLLNEQIQAAKDEISSVIKGAHDAAQKVWDGPGAALESEYTSRLNQLRDSIAARAKSLNLKYVSDDTYQSPEVWANAYRLALYQTPPGVDGTKEHQWIEDQVKAWRTYTKTYDDRKDKLRLQASQIQLSPTAKVTDVNAKVEDLQHRIEGTQAEEEPLKTELQQAQSDLAESQAAEASLDAKYYQQLSALPESSITKRLPVAQNGRFSWRQLEKDSAFSQSDRSHSYWLFARALREDGRQYWVISHFTIAQNTTLPIVIEPTSFISTKAILRPDLSADEQAQ